MNTISNAIVAWFKAQGGFAHVCVAAFVSCVGLYAKVPAFSQWIDGIYMSLPRPAHELAAAAVGVAVFYVKTHKDGAK